MMLLLDSLLRVLVLWAVCCRCWGI